jgi:hypothetical protein
MLGFDPAFARQQRARAGLPRQTSIPPVPRSQIQRLDSRFVRSSPAPARPGLPAPISVYEASAGPPGLPRPFVPVRRQVLLGARTPPAQTRGRIRPHTPRRTRRSKHISSRSLSFLVKNAPLGRRALTRRRPRHTGRVYPFLIWYPVPPSGSATHEEVIGSVK